MKKRMNHMISILMVLAVIVTALFGDTGFTLVANAVDYRGAVAYQQSNPKWHDHVWKNKGTDYTLGSFCGGFALINAMYYKTGRFLDPISTSDWANANGFGTASGIGNGIGKGQFYSKAAEHFGFQYIGAAGSVSEMLSYVRSGHACCVCVPGHWVAVVDYDSSTDMYLVLDSSVSSSTSSGSGKRTRLMLRSADTKAERTSSGQWTGVAWCRRSLFDAAPVTGNYGLSGHAMAILKFSGPIHECTCSDTSKNGLYVVDDPDGSTNVRKLENSSSEILTTIPNGTVVTVTKCTESWYYVKEYGGHCYAANLRPYRKPVSMVQPLLSTDQEYYGVGDTAHISWKASPDASDLEHYWLIIDGPDGRILNETMDRRTSYDFKIPAEGTYVIYSFATPHNSPNGEGSLTDVTQIYATGAKLTATADTVELNMDAGQSGTVFFTYKNLPASVNSVMLSYSESKTDIVSLTWGEWNDSTIPLTMKGTRMGETDVTVDLKNSDTGEVLDTCVVHVVTKVSVRLGLTQFYEQPEYTFSSVSLNRLDGETSFGYVVLNGRTAVGTLDCSAEDNEDSIVEVQWNQDNKTNATQLFVGFNIIPKRDGTEVVRFTYKLNGNVVSTTELSVTVYSECVRLKLYANDEMVAEMDAQEGEYYRDYLSHISPPQKSETSAFLGWFTEKTGGEQITETMLIPSATEISIYAHYEEVPVALKGDLNGDGTITVSDLIDLRDWIHGYPCDEQLHLENADINDDMVIDVFDLVLLKQRLHDRS